MKSKITKEEFKQKIICQIREGNPALKLLMRSLSLAQQCYEHRKRFRCSEFGLDVNIESIGRRGKFQVSFTEPEESQKEGWKIWHDLSDKGNITDIIHVVESIIVGEKGILFSIEEFKIEVEDYEFKLVPYVENGTHVQSILFDDYGHFSPIRKELSDFIEMCYRKRTDASRIYHDYTIDNQDLRRLVSVKWRFPLTSDELEGVETVISTAYKRPSQSPIEYMIEQLKMIQFANARW